MNSRWVFSGSKLVKQLFILVHNTVPVVKIADSVRRAPPVVFSKFRPIFNKLDLRGQIGCISKQESVAGQHFSIEWVIMRQNTVAKGERLQKCRIRSTYHVTMEIRVRIAVKLIDVFNAVNVSQKAHSLVGTLLKVIDKRAVIIRITGYGKQAFRPRLLESFHDQCSIVFRN